jgi:predicted kinase
MATAHPALIIMVGTPGSGKSTWVSNNFDPDAVYSLDMFRRMCTGTELATDATDPALSMLRTVVEARCTRRLTTVVDSTNTRAAHRWTLTGYARAATLPAVAVVMATPLDVCLARNDSRTGQAPYPGANGTRVPPAVIRKFHAQTEADPPRPGRDVDAVLRVSPNGGSEMRGHLLPDTLVAPWLAGVVHVSAKRRAAR